MPIPFVDRPPTPGEFEKLRLLLSVFQDGTGQYGYTPGWRDFERVMAALLNGTAVENKAIFDVQVPDPARPTIKAGIACKMRGELSYLDNHGRLTVEVSNSNREFWQELATNEIDHANFRERAANVGRLVVGLVERWQEVVSLERGGDIDLSRSSYVVLTYHAREGIYIVHWLPLVLPDPTTLVWSYPSNKRILGVDPETGDKVFEWYHESGGQLKYYPSQETARWASPRFSLEPLPTDMQDNTVLARAQAYFPEQWKAASGEV